MLRHLLLQPEVPQRSSPVSSCTKTTPESKQDASINCENQRNPFPVKREISNSVPMWHKYSYLDDPFVEADESGVRSVDSAVVVEECVPTTGKLEHNAGPTVGT